jgi:hypothetical protein
MYIYAMQRRYKIYIYNDNIIYMYTDDIYLLYEEYANVSALLNNFKVYIQNLVNCMTV